MKSRVGVAMVGVLMWLKWPWSVKCEPDSDIIAVITRKAASGGVMHYGKEIVSGYGFTQLMYVIQGNRVGFFSF